MKNKNWAWLKKKTEKKMLFIEAFALKEKHVKRWHHTNSTAIVSYIFNTFSNSQLAHN